MRNRNQVASRSVQLRLIHVGLIMMLLLYTMLLLSVSSAKASELTNQYCPVTTNELAEKQFFLDYQDRRIYFCCNNCKKDFLKDPDAYLANLDSQMPDTIEQQSLENHESSPHEHDEKVAGVTSDDHGGGSEASHDHDTDHGDKSSLVSFAGKFHPMLTHFPIALILSALLFSILGAFLKIQTMDYVSVYSIYLAALTGIGTVALGLAAGSSATYPSFLIDYFTWHRLLGISTGVVTLLTAYFGKRLLQKSSHQTMLAYRISLGVNAVLVGITGHIGAMLVFGPDHFTF